MLSKDDQYRVFLRLRSASESALLAHAEHQTMRQYHEEYCIKQLREGAALLGFDVTPRQERNFTVIDKYTPGPEPIGNVARRVVSNLAKPSPEVAAAYAESGYIHTRDYVAAVTEKSGGDEGAENSRGVDQPAIHHHPV